VGDRSAGFVGRLSAVRQETDDLLTRSARATSLRLISEEASVYVWRMPVRGELQLRSGSSPTSRSPSSRNLSSNCSPSTGIGTPSTARSEAWLRPRCGSRNEPPAHRPHSFFDARQIAWAVKLALRPTRLPVLARRRDHVGDRPRGRHREGPAPSGALSHRNRTAADVVTTGGHSSRAAIHAPGSSSSMSRAG
jgi:hypothetical protein